MEAACVAVLLLLQHLLSVNPTSAFFIQSSSPSTTSSCYAAAGGGFGTGSKKSSKSSPKKKTKKTKPIGFLGELESENASTSSPKLDRFGLPVITESDIFPPLQSDITRTPINSFEYNKEDIEDAVENHLGVNLNIFDENGESFLQNNKWTLKLIHKDPPVFQIENFFTKEECQVYRSIPNDIDTSEVPKAVQITSPTFSTHSISRRTSTTWFCRYDGVPLLLAKARHLLNVDLSQIEEPQIVRYKNGQEFSWHYDEIPTTQLPNGGQRIATLLVYLNDLEEGQVVILSFVI